MAYFSSVLYLQKKVRKAAELLPRDFQSAEELELYKTKIKNSLCQLLPVAEPENLLPDAERLTIPLGGDLSLTAVDVCVDGDYYERIHLYRPLTQTDKAPCVFICPGYGQAKNSGCVADLAIALARENIWAVAVDYPATGECAGRPDMETDVNNATTLALMLGASYMGLSVAHNLAALRYIKALPGVDSSRIGITGLCQGGIVLWYTAAVCDEFRAIAPVCGTTTMEAEACEYAGRQGGWSGGSPFVPGILRVADVRQMYATFAPRPLLAINNIVDMHWPYSGLGAVMDTVKKAYALYGAADRASFCLEHEIHSYTPVIINKLVSWFASALA